MPALEKYVTVESPLAQAVIKTALDQLVSSPFFNIVFLVYTGLLEGLTLAEIRAKIRKNFFKTWLASLKVWPAVQLLNFYVIPQHLRFLFVNVVALIWNTFMSTMTQRSTTEEK